MLTLAACTAQSRYRLISVDRIRQQPNGSPETGEHCCSSTMPPVCASIWRRSSPRGSVHRQHGRSSIRRSVSVEVLISLGHSGRARTVRPESAAVERSVTRAHAAAQPAGPAAAAAAPALDGSHVLNNPKPHSCNIAIVPEHTNRRAEAVGPLKDRDSYILDREVIRVFERFRQIVEKLPHVAEKVGDL